MKLCVRHLLVTVGPGAFGLGAVALNLVREQRALGLDSGIWCLDNASEVAWALDKGGLSPEAVTTFKPLGPRSFGFSPAMRGAATDAEAQGIDIIHQHGIWTEISETVSAWRRKFGRPTVIAPHGSLERWAIRKSAWKKRIALSLYERGNLRNAACFHATAVPEAEEFRSYGIETPIAIIPNGISEHWIGSDGNGRAFRSVFRLPRDSRILLYVGRITPVKNLEVFLRAMAELRESLGGWLFVVIGKDEFGYRSQLDRVIEELSLGDFVRFLGFVEEGEKRDAFAAASAVVLPSRREASPISALEALGAGVPVLTTWGTPWQDLETHHCGWWRDAGVESMAQALREVLDLTPKQLSQMGENGRRLVRDRYTWAGAAAEFERVYTWLRFGIGQPPSVLGPHELGSTQ